MQTVQRQFGKFMKRSADDSQVAILLKDFDEADNLLGRIIDSTSAWRDAWSSLLTYQSRMISEFENIYAPIVGSSDSSSPNKAVLTPESTLARTTKLREEYEDLRKELLNELTVVDQRMIQPASQARDCFNPVKKTIKKREDRKLDYERYQSRVDSYSKKAKRSDRDNTNLSKAEIDLAKATEDYHAADEHLRQRLPPLITAAFSMLPHLLAAQIEIQNTMLAHYYTAIYNYSQEEKFPSPPLPMEQIVLDWQQILLPVQEEVEGFGCLANGKAVQRPQSKDDSRNGGYHSNGHGPTGMNYRHPSGQSSAMRQRAISPARRISPPSPANDTRPTPVFETKPRVNGLTSPPPSSGLTSPSTYLSSDSSLTRSSEYTHPSPTGPSTVSARTDYFSHNPSSVGNGSTTPGYNVLATAVGKKKPPPPPKPRTASNTALYVTALYDFGGQSPGDLAFREGDRIRVLQKTESTDDWWEGELRGVKGSFPANYVE
ncbi:BAR and SH3 domain-containing protein [Aspergillus tanneri]|uniref:SH3 domain-containing protein n=1 Tax=Aspergillus tanneri TaxID=1220188 RepID=A0A5M9M8I7_9EURO|nr:uncharacterized protein ATNIH1004_010749 [Aspergillus tanneri]KAA8641810.1 hypothetical protein ATNIH1004_010749 [Aspergillus tanneri]